ncbi:MAG: MATE family efflux transporter [SAR324 cluster bacterium]|nr:MATE family efflux transporter [SAR324 cluster bacterium]
MNLSPQNRTIVKLAIPTILMNISLPFIGAVDTAVVGHLEEVFQVGAVSLGSLIFTILFWAFGFFRMTTVGLAAQAHGRDNAEECAEVLARGLILGLIFGIFLIFLAPIINEIAFYLMDATPQVEIHAREYFLIRVYGAPAVFITMVFTGWFYGLKNIIFPVILTVFNNAINVVLDLWFVWGLSFKSEGVAWASLIAHYLGAGLMILLFFAKYRSYWKMMRWEGVLDQSQLLSFMKTNFDIMVRTLSLLFAHAIFMAKSAALGDAILAVNTILIQFRHITSYALDGFATAAEVAVGSALGAGKQKDFLQTIKLVQRWGMIVGAGFSLFYLAGFSFLPSLLTHHQNVLELAAVYMIWIVLEPLVSNIPFILDGIFIGATGTKTMRNTMLFSVFVVYLPLFYLLAHFFGNHGMLAATLILYVTRGASLQFYIQRLTTQPGYRLL